MSPLGFGRRRGRATAGACKREAIALSNPDRERSPAKPGRARGRLRIGDDWNALTIIALSQSSPLKAIAELVERMVELSLRTEEHL
jgi:hypothetical protein